MKRLAFFFQYADWRIAILLFFLFLFTFVHFKVAVVNVNCLSRLFLCLSVLESGTMKIDRYEQFTTDKGFHRGHYFSDKAPGTSLLAWPIVAAGYYALRSIGINDFTTPQEHSDWDLPMPNRNLEIMLLVASLPISFVCALAVAFFYLLGIRVGASRRVALVGALLFGVGTPYWVWATILFGHSLAAAFLLLGLYGGISLMDAASKPEVDSRGETFLWTGVGFLLSCAVLIEYPCAAASVMIGVFFLSMFFFQRKSFGEISKKTACLLAGATPIVLFFLSYNTLCFGGPLTIGYEGVYEKYPEMMEGFFGIRLPDPTVVWKTSFSPERGLFWYSPFLILSPILALHNIYRNKYRELNLLALAVFLFFFFLNASYAYWHHSSIPCRHSTPGLPFAVIPFLFREDESRWLSASVNTLIFLTLFVRLAAFFTPLLGDFSPDQWDLLPFVRLMFRGAGFNLPTLAGLPYGLSVVVVICVWSLFGLLICRELRSKIEEEKISNFRSTAH